MSFNICPGREQIVFAALQRRRRDWLGCDKPPPPGRLCTVMEAPQPKAIRLCLGFRSVPQGQAMQIVACEPISVGEDGSRRRWKFGRFEEDWWPAAPPPDPQLQICWWCGACELCRNMASSVASFTPHWAPSVTLGVRRAVFVWAKQAKGRA